MIDIRKQPALIERINGILSVGHKVEIKREKDSIVVIGVEEQRKLVGKFELHRTKA